MPGFPMMLKAESYFPIFLAVLEVIFESSATTHWVVTENGKIEPQADTVFEMRRPDDLLAFLDQEKRNEAVKALFESIMKRKAVIEEQLSKLDSAIELEHRLLATDSDCILGSKPLSNIDLYGSIVLTGPSVEENRVEHILDNADFENDIEVPDCKKTFPLDFSMHTFEHLTAMQNRKNLIQHAEIDLLKYLPTNIDIDKFGHQIAYSLSHNKTSWLHLNLASIYWRIKGNAYNALECSRRAIVSAPRQYRDIPLLTTSGILHAAQYSGEAAIILHLAIDYNPTQSLLHLALGHIYVVLGDYKRAIACYDNCIKLSPTLSEAKQAKHALLCHLKFEKQFTSLHEHMQDILKELHTYHSEHEEWFELAAHLSWQQAIRFPNTDIIVDAFQKSNQLFKQANINVQLNTDKSLQSLEDMKNQAKVINDQLIKSKNLQGFRNVFEITKSSIQEELKCGEERKPSNVDVIKKSFEFDDSDWPEKSVCDGSEPFWIHTKQYMPIYVSPESKGYEMDSILNKLIDIEPGKKHTLPWYPPICEVPKKYDQKYISTTLLSATDSYNLPDDALKPILTDLAKNADFAEIGQRILTAIKLKVAAPWVLSMLASLHWRVVGKPRNALDCLQLALDSVPMKYKDVPLVSIASISHKVGLVDDARRIALEALHIDRKEPATNFLIGALLHIKGNHSGAIYYLKQALRMDIKMYNDTAYTLLRTLACNEKYAVAQNRPGCSGNGIDLHSSNFDVYLPSGLLNKYNLHDSDTVLCKDEGKNCKHIDCYAMDFDDLTGTGFWSIHRVSSKETQKQHGVKKGKYRDPHRPRVDIEETSPNDLRVKIALTDKIDTSDIARVLQDLLIPGTPERPLISKQEVIDENEKFLLSRTECQHMQDQQWNTFHFVWNSFAARNVNIKHDIEVLDQDLTYEQPICRGDKRDIRYIIDIDTLPRTLPRKAETDMLEWLTKMSGNSRDTFQQLGTKIAIAMQKNATSWTLALAAAFYWRITGDSRRAFDCIRQALEVSPTDVRDVSLIALASLLSARNYHQQALKIAQMALASNPRCAVNHFVIANVHAALGDFVSAISFYKSTLAIDSEFEPALKRLQAILCFLSYEHTTAVIDKVVQSVL